MTAAAGFKRLGVAIAAVLVIGVGVLTAVSLLIPADSVSNAVRAEIQAVTGFDPVARGGVAVSLFPWGTVSFDDVTLGDDGNGRPAIAAERLTAHLRLFSLMFGRIEASDVALVRPRIAVTFEPDGRSNWSGLVDKLALEHKSDASRASELMSFSEIRITGGSIVVHDDAHAIDETLSGVEMSLAWPSISNTFGATGRFVWRNEPIDASVSLGDFFAALGGDRAGLKVRLSGAPFKFAFDGHLSRLPTFKMEGTLSAGTPSMRAMMAWAGKEPLPGGGFGRFALKAHATVVGGAVAMSGVNVELDGNSAEGVLALANDGRLVVQGTLAADEIDLTPYVSTIQLLGTVERDWSRVPLGLDGLDGYDVDLRLSAGRITVANVKLGRTAIGANLRAGHMAVTIGESQAFGGVLKGSISLTKSETGVDAKTQLQFADVDLDACLREVFSFRRLEGKGNMALTLEAGGDSVLALTQTLNGQATLNAHQGALTGFNVEQLLRRLESRPLSGGGEFRTGRTPFEKLTVSIKFAQGTATVEDIRMDGAAVRLALGGSASIPTRNFDLKGTASLVPPTATDAASPFELPFVIQGPWDDPLMLPDTQILIRRSGAAAPLLEAVKDRQTGEAVRSAIERLTGAAAATPRPAAPPASTAPLAAEPGSTIANPQPR